MAEVVLFHHVMGLTAGVVDFADRLRSEGHEVHTPDLFDGQRFPTIEEGLNHVRSIGFGAVVERGTAAIDGLPQELIYAGFSLGVVPAQRLAQTRAGAKGALLFEACVPVEEFGPWPDSLPVQVHGMDHDAFFADEGDLDAARALIDVASQSAKAELFLYDGDQHLFADSSLPSYNETAASLLMARVLTFLAEVG